MKYKAKLKIKTKDYWNDEYYDLTVKFYKLPNPIIRFDYGISNTYELLSSLNIIDNEANLDNEKFVDKCNYLFLDNKEELYEMIKVKLIEVLNDIKDKCVYEAKISDIKKIQEAIKSVNENLIIEI